MAEIAAPHPAVPFTIGRDGCVVVEQGSVENEKGNIYNICVCPQGTRDDLPDFGIPDETFHNYPVNVDALQEALTRWEPAANLTIEEHREAAGEAGIIIEV